MSNQTQTIHFPKSEFNRKCNNLLNQGFDEYLTTIEDGITHSIFLNTIPGSPFVGWIVDVYDDGRITYSK